MVKGNCQVTIGIGQDKNLIKRIGHHLHHHRPLLHLQV